MRSTLSLALTLAALSTLAPAIFAQDLLLLHEAFGSPNAQAQFEAVTAMDNPRAQGRFGSVAVPDMDSDGFRDVAVSGLDVGLASGAITYLSSATGLVVGELQSSGFSDLVGLDLGSAGDVDGTPGDELIFIVKGAGLSAGSRVQIRSILPNGDTWYCGGAPVNSSGQPARVDTTGSTSLAANGLRLLATDLPSQTFGFFIISDAPEAPPVGLGHPARVCLGGNIGRLIGPGQVQSSGALGSLDVSLDLTAIPSATGFYPAPVGERLYVQAWYRDLTPAGALTSRLSDAYAFRVTP